MAPTAACPSVSLTDLNVYYTTSSGKKGVVQSDIFTGTTYYDTSKNDFKQGGLEAWMTVLDSASDNYLSKVMQFQTNGGSLGNTYTVEKITELRTNYENDKTNLDKEYKFLYEKYQTALCNFFKAVQNNQTNDASNYLGVSIALNQRLNALFSIMQTLSNRFTTYTGQKVAAGDSLNDEINAMNGPLYRQYQTLTSDANTITNQKAMIRFTEEKNNYVTNQISLWASLNILALASIFYVYRNM